MTRRGRRAQPVEDMSSGQEVVDEGAERYMWAFPEGDRVVFSIPGLRDLMFSVNEARTIGGMLIRTADEIVKNCNDSVEVGGDNGASGEFPIF